MTRKQNAKNNNISIQKVELKPLWHQKVTFAAIERCKLSIFRSDSQDDQLSGAGNGGIRITRTAQQNLPHILKDISVPQRRAGILESSCRDISPQHRWCEK